VVFSESYTFSFVSLPVYYAYCDPDCFSTQQLLILLSSTHPRSGLQHGSASTRVPVVRVMLGRYSAPDLSARTLFFSFGEVGSLNLNRDSGVLCSYSRVDLMLG